MADSQQPQGTEKAKGPKMKPLGDTYATGSPANPEGGEAKRTAGEGATTLGDTYATGSPADPEAKILDRPEGDEKK